MGSFLIMKEIIKSIKKEVINMNNALNLWKRNNLNPYRSFSQNLEKLFDEWMGVKNFAQELDEYGFNPRCEASETKDAYELKFDLPGIPKDAIKIDLHENQITVSGERKEEKTEQNKKRHFSEVFYGSFTRNFSFPTKLDVEKTEAKYENGVLSIHIPKLSATQSRQVTIK